MKSILSSTILHEDVAKLIYEKLVSINNALVAYKVGKLEISEMFKLFVRNHFMKLRQNQQQQILKLPCVTGEDLNFILKEYELMQNTNAKILFQIASSNKANLETFSLLLSNTSAYNNLNEAQRKKLLIKILSHNNINHEILLKLLNIAIKTIGNFWESTEFDELIAYQVLRIMRNDDIESIKAVCSYIEKESSSPDVKEKTEKLNKLKQLVRSVSDIKMLKARSVINNFAFNNSKLSYYSRHFLLPDQPRIENLKFTGFLFNPVIIVNDEGKFVLLETEEDIIRFSENRKSAIFETAQEIQRNLLGKTPNELLIALRAFKQDNMIEYLYAINSSLFQDILSSAKYSTRS